MNKDFFSINTWRMRFQYAFNGLKGSFAAGHSMCVHLSATIMVIGLSVSKGVTHIEAIVVAFAIAAVWAAELFNTAIEKLADRVCSDYDVQIKMIKDLSAAAVLVVSIAALISGLIIFIPKFR